MMGEIDPERVLQLQFHQSYSYEDLIMGYRPTETNFELKRGPFYEFCKRAESDDPKSYYFVIIDEINRGNLSKIFGELLMLIEADKRGPDHAIKLMYSEEESFYIPENIYIIGMMNTADRSLALIDYALRRRFAFYTMQPAFENEKFKKMLERTQNTKLEKLVNQIKLINQEILADDSLGEGFVIGHSYFTKDYRIEDQSVSNIITYEIEPLLKEYWYDDAAKLNASLLRLRSIVSDFNNSD